jgi:uncharacterized protein (TIGR02246 family)
MSRPSLAALAALALLAAAAPGLAQEARREDHEQLRALLRTVTQAINDKDLKALGPVMLPDVSITTVDQQRFRGLPEFERYWSALFSGERAAIRKVTLNPTADDLTHFLDESTGLAYGTSTDTWAFTDGDVRTMTVRWTAALRKADGAWKVAALHVGTNLLDNPVLAAVKATAWKVAAALGVGGLAIGFLAGRLVPRRRR